MSKLLDGIQDNYTFAQPGIQKKVAALKELTLRIDGQLSTHVCCVSAYAVCLHIYVHVYVLRIYIYMLCVYIDTFFCVFTYIHCFMCLHTYVVLYVYIYTCILSLIANLHHHIESQGIEFLQFTFRWMNNLLMRELPLRCTIRLWDTYLVCNTHIRYVIHICGM